MQQEHTWTEIKEIWDNSAQGTHINFQVSKLINELKDKVSQFEKDSVKSDMHQIKSSFENFKGKVSQFEKDSIKRDLRLIRSFFKKIKSWFKR